MIVELILQGYVPLSYSSGINRIVYKPKQYMQLILGDNGSGKSSLLLALSLAPLDKNLFYNDGYRALTVKDTEGNIYRLISDYSGKSPKHEFWLNDDNLNPGGTGSVQKELVEHHLKYTTFIHKILSGKSSFCSMPTKAKEELLVSISNVDMEYAYDQWRKVTTLYRDAVGVDKHLQARHTDTVKRLEQLNADAMIVDIIRTIEERLTGLIGHTNFSVKESDIVKLTNDLNVMCDRLHQESDKVVALHKTLSQDNNQIAKIFRRYGSHSPLTHAISHLEYGLNHTTDRIKEKQNTMSQYSDIQQRIAALPKDANLESIKVRLSVVNDKLTQYKEPSKDVLDWADCYATLAALKQRFMLVVESLPIDCPSFTKESLEAVIERYNNATEKMQRLTMSITNLEHSVSHMESILAGAVECPKCNHKIVSDTKVSANALNGLKTKLTELNTIKVKADADYIVVRQHYEHAMLFKRALTETLEILKTLHLLREPMSQLGNLFEIVNQRQRAINVFDRLLVQVEQNIAYSELKKEQQQLLFFYDTLMANASVSEQWEQMEAELSTLIRDKSATEQQIKTLKSNLGVYERTLKALDGYTVEFMSICDMFLKLFDLKRSDIINNETRRLQSRLAELQATVREVEILKNRVTEIETDIVTYRKRMRLLKQLVDASSPNTGIIGKQLYAINCGFVNAINSIVDQVWEKDIAMALPELGKNTKYNVLINGKPGPDLNDLSSGQQDMFDLAVSIVVMSQLGLNDYPLYLDEVGKTFDERHRDNLMLFIKNLVSTGVSGMVFIVSHYAEQHGGFSNVDINVLDDSNIIVRSDCINENLEIYR
jgi:DNA repair exonuclease SbcCD ATPase subunit